MNREKFKKHIKIIIACVFALSMLGISYFCTSDFPEKNVSEFADTQKNIQNIGNAAKENSDKSENKSLTEKENENGTRIEKDEKNAKKEDAQNSRINKSDNAENGKMSNNENSASGENTKTGEKIAAEVIQNDNETPAKNDNAKNNSEKSDAVKKVCTLSISCNTVLKNISSLSAEKQRIIPKDGVVLSETKAEFYDGETVFNVLLRETKKHKIHFEFSKTPVYSSAYVEGIANIYEYDAGELSGWMYKVNGVFPNMGCSRYKLKNGDKIEWVYTCDLGKDVGGYFKTGGGQKDE